MTGKKRTIEFSSGVTEGPAIGDRRSSSRVSGQPQVKDRAETCTPCAGCNWTYDANRAAHYITVRQESPLVFLPCPSVSAIATGQRDDTYDIGVNSQNGCEISAMSAIVWAQPTKVTSGFGAAILASQVANPTYYEGSSGYRKVTSFEHWQKRCNQGVPAPNTIPTTSLGLSVSVSTNIGGPYFDDTATESNSFMSIGLSGSPTSRDLKNVQGLISVAARSAGKIVYETVSFYITPGTVRSYESIYRLSFAELPTNPASRPAFRTIDTILRCGTLDDADGSALAEMFGPTPGGFSASPPGASSTIKGGVAISTATRAGVTGLLCTTQSDSMLERCSGTRIQYGVWDNQPIVYPEMLSSTIYLRDAGGSGDWGYGFFPGAQ